MADWEIFDGKTVQGPFSEAALVDSIRRGLPPTMLVREVGAPEWRSMREHGPFAVALLSAPPPPAPPPSPPPPQTIIQRVNVSGGDGCANACGLLLLLLLLIFVGVPCAGVMLR